MIRIDDQPSSLELALREAIRLARRDRRREMALTLAFALEAHARDDERRTAGTSRSASLVAPGPPHRRWEPPTNG
jgi:hypothetical protein